MKRLLIVFLIFVLSFQIVSAVEFTMNENYQQGETILAKVSGNFLTSLTKDNVFFYRGHVRIPIEYNVAEIKDEYYIYALTTGKDSGNYSIAIENMQYMKGAEITDEKIIKNFSITNELADFSVNQGVVVTSNDFFLQIQNLQENKITVDINTESNASEGREIFVSLPESGTSKEGSISVKSGEIKDIHFTLGEGESGLQQIELKTENLTYEIPVYISASEGKKEKDFYFEPSELISLSQTNTKTKRIIYLYNTGDDDIKNISLSLSDSLKPFVNISVSKIEMLKNNSNIPVELSFFSSTETETEGYLKAKADNLSVSSFIIFNFNVNYTAPANETEISSSTKNCAELNGTLFNTQTEKCDKEYENVKDGWCCFGTVSKIETNNSTPVIIAIILSALVIGILIWFYLKKYKKAKKPINLLKIAKGKK